MWPPFFFRWYANATVCYDCFANNISLISNRYLHRNRLRMSIALTGWSRREQTENEQKSTWNRPTTFVYHQLQPQLDFWVDRFARRTMIHIIYIKFNLLVSLVVAIHLSFKFINLQNTEKRQEKKTNSLIIRSGKNEQFSGVACCCRLFYSTVIYINEIVSDIWHYIKCTLWSIVNSFHRRTNLIMRCERQKEEEKKTFLSSYFRMYCIYIVAALSIELLYLCFMRNLNTEVISAIFCCCWFGLKCALKKSK